MLFSSFYPLLSLLYPRAGCPGRVWFPFCSLLQACCFSSKPSQGRLPTPCILHASQINAEGIHFSFLTGTWTNLPVHWALLPSLSCPPKCRGSSHFMCHTWEPHQAPASTAHSCCHPATSSSHQPQGVPLPCFYSCFIKAFVNPTGRRSQTSGVHRPWKGFREQREAKL